MSHVFLAINGDGVGESIGSAIISDNHDELSRLSSSIKNAHQMIDQWVEGQGGKIIVSSGDEAIYQLPQAAMSQIEGVRKKYNQLANTTLTAGVGSTMSEASKALIYGKMNNKNQVVHYEPQIDEMIAGADGEDEALPTEEDITNDGNIDAEQQQGVEGEEGDTDSEDDQQAQFGDEDNSETGEEDNGEANGEDQEQFQDGMSDDEDAEPGLDEGEEDLDADENAEQDVAAASAGQPPVGQQKPGIEQKNPNIGQKQANVEQKPGQVGQKQAAPPQAQAGQPPFGQKKQAPPAAPQAQPGMEDNGEMDDESLDDDSQPAHEQGLNPEQDMEHDAEENEDDEQDADNVEADEEVDAFGGNTEPADDDLEDDITDDAVNQTLDQEGMEGDEDAEMEDDSMDGDPSMGEDDQMVDENGDGMEDGSVDEDGMIDDDMEDGDSDGVLSEMMHANMGDEQAEDNDDEIRSDIVDSLQSFKANKPHLEELKQSNPELYQATIMMLRATIQMAKKFGLNPDRAAAEAEHSQGVQDAFPENDDVNVNDEQVEKGEKNKVKGVHQSYMAPGESFAGELSREGKRKPGKMGEQNKDVARSFHKQKLKEMKTIKPNLPKSEIMKAKVDSGKSINQKQDDRSDRKSQPKGIHIPTHDKNGQSGVGTLTRDKQLPQTNKRIHQKVLSEQKQIKPNLPKSEKDVKVENLNINIKKPKA